MAASILSTILVFSRQVTVLNPNVSPFGTPNSVISCHIRGSDWKSDLVNAYDSQLQIVTTCHNMHPQGTEIREETTPQKQRTQ
jgi:hypothetical protein